MGVLKNQIPWDLRQRGQRDSTRHGQKVRDAIKKNLHNIIADESIITTDGKRATKVPIKYLDSYHFKHGTPKDAVGHGDGEKGTVLRPGQKGDKTGKPGNQPGVDIYDAEISIDELTQMMIEDLGLPWFDPKNKKEIITKEAIFTDIRKKGIFSNWAKKRTVMENMKRNALEKGKAKFGDLKDDDMRFRTWEERIERHSNAVIYLMMDRSGSMDEHKRYLCKATFWWICRFLERRYENFEVVFIAHDHDARVVPEKDFFTISNDGGTRCSSAIELAWQDIKETRPKDIWNVYCFHFSDGENYAEDNQKCASLVKEMLDNGRVNMFGYGEVAWENPSWGGGSSDGLITALQTVQSPRLITHILHNKSDVFKTLEKFLSQDMNGTMPKPVVTNNS